MNIPLFVSERSKPERTLRPLSVGCLVFERMDQIDFTGPFEVLSRMPDTAIQIIGKAVEPVRDVQGLRLSPDVRIAEAGTFDVLLVPGGYGQQALMHDEEVLDFIRKHAQKEKLLFSVCTGALLCGAAGALAGRKVTTHWSARHLMRYYGAVLVDARVAVDGNLISAAGVTAGLDAALARWFLSCEEMRPLRRSSSPSSTRRSQFFTAELLKVRHLRCLRDFRKSTSRSGGKDKRRRSSMRRRRGINARRHVGSDS